MSCINTNVAEFLLAGKPANRVALRFLHGDKTYGDLREAVSALSRYFGQLGCRKGERVLLAADNSFLWVVGYISILNSGLVCVPVPLAIAAEQLEHVIALTEPRTAVAQASFALTHAALLQNTHLVTDGDLNERALFHSTVQLSEILSLNLSVSTPSCEIGAHDLAALMFTSGSTGKPRGVMISHGNIVANTESIMEYLRLTEDDRIMTVLPFHYCFGTSLLHTHLRAGASLVVDPRFMYPEVILQRMAETECTGFAGVPAHFQVLLRKSSLKKRSFRHLRYVQQAGGPLAPVFIRELMEALPDTQIFIMYGQTEATARLSYLPPELLDTKLGSVGKGIPGVKLQVVNDDGVQVQPGEVGEILAEGENIALGYWREPEETAAAFRGRTLHTGDLATVDEDGFIYVVDRAGDFLKCGGERVSCRFVENQLQDFKCVLDAAVLGVPDETWGEAVKAFLVARMPGCPSFHDCFERFCKEHMVAKLRPREVVMLNSLPRNSAGKVIKRSLRDPKT